jgi:hypothetical protein
MYPSTDHKKMDKIVEEASKGTALGEKKSKENERDKRRMVWNAISDLGYAACDLYKEGDLSFDEAVSQFIQALNKLKGKESKLMGTIKNREENAVHDY